MKPLEEYLTPTQSELFGKLREMYKGRTSICKKGYILVRGEAPVMLLAHLDTVHKEPVRQICKTQNGNILMSPQGIGGDDRCGVYALTAAYAQSAIKPWLLFTCDEETGGIGAEKFCDAHKSGKMPKELAGLKLLIEIDRKGETDAVYYDCDNPEFEEYITSKGFETDWGSFSDISYVAPELGVAAVNLSSGYYNAHTLHEYIDRKQLNAVVRRVIEIVADAVKPSFPKYEYVERLCRYGDVFDRGWYIDHLGGTRKTEKGLAVQCDDYYDTVADPDVLENIPKELWDEYLALLDFYSSEEIEQFRAEMGDNAIRLLCEAEFGDDYYGMFGDADDYEDEEAMR